MTVAEPQLRIGVIAARRVEPSSQSVTKWQFTRVQPLLSVGAR